MFGWQKESSVSGKKTIGQIRAMFLHGANIGLVFVQTAPAPNVELFKSIGTIKTPNQSDRR